MKKYCLSFYLLLLPFISVAQNQIGYGYDSGGNRVKRKIIMTSPKGMAKPEAFHSQNQIYVEALREHTVSIYPNPTEGDLMVRILSLTDSDKCVWWIYTNQGKQILTGKVVNGCVDININNQPSGIYLLKITINNQSTTWKIIKK